jgi:futalosine hydrolase
MTDTPSAATVRRPPVGGGSPTLLLFPTDLERRRFLDAGGLPPGLALPALCGFGPVAAAARTAELLARLRPRRVLLLGIAGAYDLADDPLGCARSFDAVTLDGVGAGEGEGLRGPSALGFPQWPGSVGEDQPAIEERLSLDRPPPGSGVLARPLLVSSCAAADGEVMAERRRRRFPGAAAEDMEAFAVAFACALARVPLCVVRGISNLVGDRDPRRWRIPQALAAARTAAIAALEGAEWEPAP